MRLFGLCAAFLLFSLQPLAASAQARNPLIAQGESQYDDLRYEEALQTLSAALVRTGNSVEDQVTIYRLLAFTYLALERPEEATGAYRSLLALNPDFTPGRVSPRVRDFFAQVTAAWNAEGRPGVAARPPAPVTIAHRSPPQAERNAAQELVATLDDPDGRVEHLVLAYRQGTNAVFTRLEATRRGADFVATVPADAVAPPLVEYYFEALDRNGLPVASRGDVAAPLRIAVPAPGGDVTSEWWFWTIIGVVVVGAAVGIGVGVATSSSGPAAQGTFTIDIR